MTELKPGDCFGNVQLEFMMKCRVFAQATSVASCMRLSVAALTHGDDDGALNEGAAFGILRKIPLLAPVSDEYLHKVEGMLVKMNFNAGDKLSVEGTVSNKMYIVVKGAVRLTRARGSARIAGGLCKFFGERQLLPSDRPARETAIAVGHVEVGLNSCVKLLVL